MNKCCAGKPDASPDAAQAGCGQPSPAAPGLEWLRVRIDQMDCPTEEALIRGKLEALEEVHELHFDLLQRRLSVRHRGLSEERLTGLIAGLGMTARPVDDIQHTRIHIAQLCCPTEETLLRQRLESLPGVVDLQFATLQRTLILGHTARGLDSALAAIRELGFTPSLTERPQPASATAKRGAQARLVLAGGLALLAEVLHLGQGAPQVLIAALALAAVALSGLGVYRKGWIALKNRNLNINALMSIAVTGALVIGEWPEAAMVMVLFALAELIEARSLDRARHAIRTLMAMTPEQATVRQSDGRWRAQPAAEVAIGSIVRVRPGERIALDGVVRDGYSTVDQAAITGESLPVEKRVGDGVYAGTVNRSGLLEVQVSALAADSALARIIHAVEQAQSARAPTQRLVDRFARIYTPAVVGLALLIAVLPPLLWQAPWYDWIYRALVLLVVACPCALVISTPVSIVSALAAAARQGILIKGGAFLEKGRQITHLALDKTGTLTHGQPALTDFIALRGDTPEFFQAVAASLAQRSTHPVSRAIAAHYAGRLPELAVAAFEQLPGLGVRGVIDGLRYHLGNPRLLDELGLDTAPLREQLAQLEADGKSLVLLASASQVVALFAVADTARASSQAAIADLHALGVRTLMLSGDNSATVQAIARQVGIDDAQGNLLPEDKLAAIDALARPPHTVAMAGDGINDAPALARADIGFAMGAIGSDVALETADVAIMDDDLRRIPAFIRLSRRTVRVLKQNIVLAVAIKLVFLLLTISGHATLWMAVFADMGVSLLVVANGLRLLRIDKDSGHSRG